MRGSVLVNSSSKHASSFETIYICPDKGHDLNEQFDSCILQLKGIIPFFKSRNLQLVKQTYFIKSRNSKEYIGIFDIINGKIGKQFSTFTPYSVVAQAPANNLFISAEYTFFEVPNGGMILPKKIKGISYLDISSPLGNYIISSGLGVDVADKNDIFLQSNRAFEQMSSILEHEKLSFSNVVRQWNYIEKIIDTHNANQHYQIFNDVRTHFYSRSEFNHGYPAATGIGQDSGGIIIDFIALKENNSPKVTTIKSQVQTDAHQYSSSVLAESHIPLNQLKTTPKFERAKALTLKNEGIIYISGTAAIKGEQSAVDLTVGQQTEMTLLNIARLYEKHNLFLHGIEYKTATPISYRVYIKNQNDYLIVKSVIDRLTGEIPVIYVIADVCRPELLVEIEAVIGLNF